MAFDLAELAAPMTRSAALRAGFLIDASRAAAFAGFTYPSALTCGAWDEAIGLSPHSRADKAAADNRLCHLWSAAKAAVSTLHAPTYVLPFRVPTARGVGLVHLHLRCVRACGGQPALTVMLPAEA